MSISIGKSKNNHRSLVQYPSNKGIANIAQNKMQQVVGQANRRHLEALSVDPLNLFVWIKQRSGRFCSCQGSKGTGLSVFDKRENESKANIPDSKLITSDTNEINLSWNKPKLVEPVVSSSAPLSTAEEYLLKKYYNIDNPSEVSDEVLQLNKNSLNGDQGLPTDQDILNALDDVVSPSEQALMKQLNGVSIAGGDKTKCGICFGTGYTDGYQLHNGKRYVLDALNAVDNNGFILNKNNYPYTLESNLNSNNYIIWNLEIPTYFESFLNFYIRNNFKDTSGVFELFLRVKGDSTWTSQEDIGLFVNNRNGQSSKLEVMLKPKEVINNTIDVNRLFKLTHIELYFQLSKLPLGSMPNLNKSTQWEIFDVLLNQNMEVEASVIGLDRECVICEDKFGYAWKVVDCEKLSTSFGQVFNWNLQVRLIQNYEILHLLNLVRGKVDINYQKLERKQGNIS